MTALNRDLKQPIRVCGRRPEKTSEVWVENVVQSIFIYTNATGHIRVFFNLTKPPTVCFNILRRVFFFSLQLRQTKYPRSIGKGRMTDKALICSTFLILLELLDLIVIAASKG